MIKGVKRLTGTQNGTPQNHCVSVPLEPREITLGVSSSTRASSSFIFSLILLVLNHDRVVNFLAIKFHLSTPNQIRARPLCISPLEPGENTLSASSTTMASSSFIFALILLVLNHARTVNFLPIKFHLSTPNQLQARPLCISAT